MISLRTLINIVLFTAIICLSVGQPLVRRNLRAKRQLADILTTDYQARRELEKQPRTGCLQIACGLVDLIQSGKRKRTYNVNLPELRDQLAKLILEEQ